MRVWLTEIGEPLPSEPGARIMRCGILAEQLARGGHEVTWWSSNFDHFSKTFRGPADQTLQPSPNLRIRLLPGRGYRSNMSLARIRDHRQVAAAFGRQATAETPPDVICSCLPTLDVTEAAVRFANARRVPIVVDIRDLWPDAFVALAPRVVRPAIRLLIRPETRRARFILKNATGIVAVSDEYLAWGLRKAGRVRGWYDGTFPLGYPGAEIAPAERAQARAALERAGVDSHKTVCTFVGTLGRSYDLGPVIAAARSLHQRGDEGFQFVVAGDGERRERWVREAAGVANVVFTGWLSSAAIAALLEMSAVALAAYGAGVPQGLPNKIFEYLSAGVPILSSLRGETERLLAREDCGITYQAGSAQDLAAALERLRDGESRRRMGSNGRRCFDAQFSSAAIYGGLVRHLERVASAGAEV